MRFGVRPKLEVDKRFEVGADRMKLGGDILKAAQEWSCKYRNSYGSLEHVDNKFKIGDVVWYYNPTARVNKFNTKWRRKAVVKSSGYKSYELKADDGKPFRGNEDFLQKVKC